MRDFRTLCVAAAVVGLVATATVVQASAVLVQDTFSDRSGTWLAQHAPDAGGPWTVESGDWIVKNGWVWEKSKVKEIPSSDYRAFVNSGAADVHVTAQIKNTGGSEFFGVVGRYAGPLDWIMAFYDGQGDLILGMKQPDEDRFGNTVGNASPGAAGFQELGRAPVDWRPGKTRTLTLVFEGKEISVALDGTTVIGPVTDADDDNLWTTNHGIFTRGNGAARFSEFSVQAR